MSGEPTSSTPTSPGPTTAEADTPTRTGRLLSLLRKLIDYGKELAASLHHRTETTDLRPVMCAFGTRDIARILARITCGLLRAQALEDKVRHNAARLDIPPQPNPQPAASTRSPSAPRPPRDLGICPNHPLWRELQALIEEYRGNYARLVIEILDRPSLTLFESPPTAAPTTPPTPACATGPP